MYNITLKVLDFCNSHCFDRKFKYILNQTLLHALRTFAYTEFEVI